MKKVMVKKGRPEKKPAHLTGAAAVKEQAKDKTLYVMFSPDYPPIRLTSPKPAPSPISADPGISYRPVDLLTEFLRTYAFVWSPTNPFFEYKEGRITRERFCQLLAQEVMSVLTPKS